MTPILPDNFWKKRERCWACKRVVSLAAWRRGEVEELDISTAAHDEPYVVVVHRVDGCESKTLKQIRAELAARETV